jgi:chromosome segregation ATPase
MAVAEVTTGHPCTMCEATMEQCDTAIRETGAGCCRDCFERDTHGLLDPFRIIDVRDLQQEVDNLTRLMAQTVIARGEHAKLLRRLQADANRLTEENAMLRARIIQMDRERDLVDEEMEVEMLTELLTRVREVVEALPERVAELEDCVAGIEGKLKLKRRPKEARDQVRDPD